MASRGYGASSLAKMPAPNTITSTITLAIASRCRKKRLRAYHHWLRAFSSRPVSKTSSAASGTVAAEPTISAGSPATCCGAATVVGTGGGATDAGLTLRGSSVIADPRVEEAVEDVGDEVEDDHHDRDDDEPRHHRIR